MSQSVNDRIEAKHTEIFRNYIRLTTARQCRDRSEVRRLEASEQTLWEELSKLEREERESPVAED